MNKLSLFNRPTIAALLLICSGCLVLSSCKTETPAPNPSGSGSSPSGSLSSGSPSASVPSPSPSNTTSHSGSERLGPDPIQLLQSDQIKAELKLTDDQVTQIRALQTDLQTRLTKEYEEIKGLPKEKQIEAVEKKIEPINKESKAKMDKILQPEQAKRAREILLQIFDFGIMTRNDFTAELKITDAQQKQLNTISEQVATKLKTTVELPSGDATKQAKIISDNRKRIATIIKEGDTQAKAVLTAEQKKNLETLKGKTFSFKPPTPSPGAQP